MLPVEVVTVTFAPDGAPFIVPVHPDAYAELHLYKACEFESAEGASTQVLSPASLLLLSAVPLPRRAVAIVPDVMSLAAWT